KSEAVRVLGEDHPDSRAGLYLAFDNQGGQRLGQVLVDGALQFPGAVFRTRALCQKKSSALVADFNIEALIRKAAVHMLLKICDLLIENQGESLRIERLICDDSVNPV